MPALSRQRHENQEFKVILGYMRPCHQNKNKTPNQTKDRGLVSGVSFPRNLKHCMVFHNHRLAIQQQELANFRKVLSHRSRVPAAAL